MAILNREQILNAQDVETEIVSVPEWGGEVMIKGLTGKQRDEFERSLIEQNGKKITMKFSNVRARLASLSIVDESGQRLFSETDISALGNKSAVALERVFAVAQKLSGLSDKDVEELEKNSGNAQDEDSTSDSPSPSA